MSEKPRTDPELFREAMALLAVIDERLQATRDHQDRLTISRQLWNDLTRPFRDHMREAVSRRLKP